MSPQAALFLQKARRLLTEAVTMLGVDLYEAAGRSAYLAAFHAAQALIVERSGRVSKTHRGVHIEFLRLIKDDPRFDAQLRGFLSRSYNIKAIADYETGPDLDVSAERAADAVEDSSRFVAELSAIIAAAPPT